jgi:D-alanyl-D-alanine carboxypeptidase-like protein
LSRVVVAALAALAALTAPPPAFQASVAPVKWSELRYTYRAGCPVPLEQLRTIRLTHWGFDARAHEGALIVRDRVANDVVKVFRRLYTVRFPIRRMRLMSAYRGSDEASMAADNTSAFNCRFVKGTTRWSMHAYGEAIDVNTVENPYVQGARVSPPSGGRFLDRSKRRPGMAVEGGVLVRAFDEVGWHWGGRWTSSKDYQHFSTTGR